jgi:uncharacterized membrane protein YfcA
MGLVIATVVSAIGLGGGIFWMPFLLIVAGLKPGPAVATSLLIQSAGMGSSSLAYARKGCVTGKPALVFLLVALPGLTIGACFTKLLEPPLMKLILGLLVMGTALWFVSASQDYGATPSDRGDAAGAWRHSWVVGLMAVVSGMLSISVGEWLVPILRNKLHLKMSSAIGTSITVIFGTAVAATTVHYLLGSRPDLALVLWGVPGVVLGGQIGPRIATRINDRLLKEIFTFLLTLIGIHLIYNSY